MNFHLGYARQRADPPQYFRLDGVQSRTTDESRQQIDAHRGLSAGGLVHVNLHILHDPQIHDANRHLGIVEHAQHFQDGFFAHHAASGSMR